MAPGVYSIEEINGGKGLRMVVDQRFEVCVSFKTGKGLTFLGLTFPRSGGMFPSPIGNMKISGIRDGTKTVEYSSIPDHIRQRALEEYGETYVKSADKQ